MENSEVSQLQAWCDLMYSGSAGMEAAAAERNLSGFFENPENFKAIFDILATSRHPNLMFLAISALRNLLPVVWRRFSLADQNSLYTSLYNSLFTSTETYSNYFTKGLSKALARICRLGWLDLNAIKQSSNSVHLLLTHDSRFLEPCLTYLRELIQEINEPIKYRSIMLNRKVAFAFKDSTLGGIFLCCLNLLQHAQSLRENILEMILDVLINSLGFDFSGEFNNDAIEDSVGLSVPLSWAPYFQRIDHFEALYAIIINSNKDIELQAIRFFSLLGTIRKGLFVSDSIASYINIYLKTAEQIILSKALSGNCLHEFFKGLKLFLETFGLKLVSESSYFNSWLVILKDFSINLFSKDQALTSTYESSMILWSVLSYQSRLLDIPMISLVIQSLFKPYLELTLINARSQLIIDNLESIKAQIDKISTFNSYFYHDIMKDIQAKYLEFIGLYEITKTQEFQAKLAWLILLASGLLTLQNLNNSNLSDNIEISMTRLVFELIDKMDITDDALVISILLYLLSFSKAYINSSTDEVWAIMDGNQPGKSMESVLSVIVRVIFNGLNSTAHPKVLANSLELFEYLAQGRYSSKALVSVELVQRFMTRYTEFELWYFDPKLQVRIYSSLAYLWLSEGVSQTFTVLLSPMSESLKAYYIEKSSDKIERILRQLQGICSAISLQKNFLEFFNWLIQLFDIIIAACNDFLYDAKVMAALTRFLLELSDSKTGRIKFPEFSAQGLVFFKRLSEILIPYGNYIAEASVVQESMLNKIKRIFEVTNNLLSGGFVCFGVFQLYNDNCFTQTLQMIFRLINILAINQTTVIFNKPSLKLLTSLYELLDLICESHLELLFSIIDSDSVKSMMYFLKAGITINDSQSLSIKVCNSAAKAAGNFCEYFVQAEINGLVDSGIREIVQGIRPALAGLLEVIVEVIIVEDSNYVWTLGRLLMALIILNTGIYNEVITSAVTKNVGNSEARQQILDKFLLLTLWVSAEINDTTRERFNAAFSDLKNNIRILL